MNFLSVLYAKAGITVDGVTTLNNTATGLTPATNDNSTKLATTGYVKNQNYYPYPTGTTAQYVRGDGSLATFSQGGGGGGSSVNYYLNGGTSQGTIGGNTYYEMSKIAVIGTAADFNLNADGYIAQFVTDAGDPALLNIPGGNWNFEMFFSTSSSGGTPSFYVELYKYDGTTLTLISSGSTNPESITSGTATDLYLASLAVPTTTLTLTDRLAVRVYVNHSGRTITLHTQNGHLCQIITTFTTGLTALNGLTAQVQNFAVGADGSDFNISSVIDTHTFNLPTASATKRGALSSIDWAAFDAKVDFGDLSATSPLSYNGSGVFSIAQSSTSTNGYLSSTDWNTFNNKQNALTNPVTGTGTTNYVTKWISGSAVGDSIIYDNGTNVGIGTTYPTQKLHVVGSQYTTGNITVGASGNYSNVNFTRSDGAAVGGIGWRSDGIFYVGGHPDYGSGAGNDVRVYAFGANLFLGNGTSGDVLTITNAGKVGIGTTSPAAKLEVASSSSGTTILVGRAVGNSNIKALSDNGGFLALDSAGIGNALILNHYTSDNIWMVTGGGNVLINTTTDAGYKLDVNGTARVSGEIKTQNTTGNPAKISLMSGSASSYISEVDGNLNMEFVNTSTINLGDNISDIRFCTNNNLITPALKLAITGAATFSSSVTAGGNVNIKDNYALNLGYNHAGGATLLYNSNGNLDITPRSGYNTTFTAGRVGIGTGSPSNKLVVKDGATYLEFGTGTDYADILAYNRDTSVYKSLILRGSDIRFSPSDVEKMRLNADGDLLVGTTASIWGTSNRGVIQVNGVSQALIGLSVGGVGKGYLFHSGTNLYIDNTANGEMYLGTNGNTNLTISAAGAATFSSSVTAKGDLLIWGGNAAQSGFITGNSAGGGLYIAASGTNQNIRLVPSGTGFVQVIGALDVSSSVTAVGALFTSSTETRGTIRTTFTGDNSYYSLFSNDGALTLDTYGVGGSIYLKILGSTKLIIAASGNLLLGTVTDAGYKLDVNGTARVVGALTSSVPSGTGTFKITNTSVAKTWSIYPLTNGAETDINFYEESTTVTALTLKSGGAATFSSNVNVNGAPNDADIAMTIQASAGAGKFILFGRNSASTSVFNISSAGAAYFASSVTATNFIVPGGTSAQFLKADGSLDSNVYLTATSSTFSYTASVTLSPTWQNTGVSSLNLGTGAYLVTCYANDFAVGGGQYNCTYAGIMYFYADTTNGSNANEIVLHHSGHADQGRYIYLRTLGTVVADGKTYLQISGNGTNSGASNYQLTFKKLL